MYFYLPECVCIPSFDTHTHTHSETDTFECHHWPSMSSLVCGARVKSVLPGAVPFVHCCLKQTSVYSYSVAVFVKACKANKTNTAASEPPRALVTCPRAHCEKWINQQRRHAPARANDGKRVANASEPLPIDNYLWSINLQLGIAEQIASHFRYFALSLSWMFLFAPN